jgi:hypothetical protein
MGSDETADSQLNAGSPPSIFFLLKNISPFFRVNIANKHPHVYVSFTLISSTRLQLKYAHFLL